MKQKPKWIIFDVGNVLFDFTLFSKDVAELLQISREAIIEQVNEISKLGYTGEVSLEDFWGKVLSNLKLENNLHTVLHMWNNDIKYWMKDTQKLISELRSANYNVGILTNNWANQTINLWQNMSPYVETKYIFESSVEKISKPDDKLFQLVESRIGAKAEEVLFVDDVRKYLEGAEKRCWQTFQYVIGEDFGLTSNDLLRKQLL